MEERGIGIINIHWLLFLHLSGHLVALLRMLISTIFVLPKLTITKLTDVNLFATMGTSTQFARKISKKLKH